MSKRVLLCGDAVVSTGFAKMNHAYIDGLRGAGWDVHVLGINYFGDPHDLPYKVWPCRAMKGGDPFGVSRIPELVGKLRPDVICVTQDPWNVQPYVQKAGNVPVVISAAVDGLNCRGRNMNGAAGVAFWTRFGEREAQLGGYTGNSVVIPLGVDTDMFKPHDMIEARAKLGLPKDAQDSFIVGSVGRNQPRKRLDLTLIYFAEWIKSRKIENAFLFLHTAPTGEVGYDLDQLARYLKISSKMIISEPEIGVGVHERQMVATYRAMDVMLSTSQGEGWGLCQMEAMACRVPSILPDWAAFSEWPEDGAERIACTSMACTPSGVNAIGGIMDKEDTLRALDTMYDSVVCREQKAQRGMEVVRQPQYRWKDIGERFAAFVEDCLR